MTFPTIHLGGTHAGSLLEGQIHIMNTLRNAIEAMQQNGPNGRDYLRPGAIQAALEEHEERILKLRNILAEVEAIAMHIAKGVK